MELPEKYAFVNGKLKIGTRCRLAKVIEGLIELRLVSCRDSNTFQLSDGVVVGVRFTWF